MSWNTHMTLYASLWCIIGCNVSFDGIRFIFWFQIRKLSNAYTNFMSLLGWQLLEYKNVLDEMFLEKKKETDYSGFNCKMCKWESVPCNYRSCSCIINNTVLLLSQQSDKSLSVIISNYIMDYTDLQIVRLS